MQNNTVIDCSIVDYLSKLNIQTSNKSSVK